jgi:hypothetical protein
MIFNLFGKANVISICSDMLIGIRLYLLNICLRFHNNRQIKFNTSSGNPLPNFL